MSKFGGYYSRVRSGRMSQAAASEELGISDRTFRRWADRFDQNDPEGFMRHTLDHAAARRIPVDEAIRLCEAYQRDHEGWTVKHFWDHRRAHHGLQYSYSWTKSVLQSREIVPLAPRRGAHRRKRPRKPMIGMMLHQDASRHEWLGQGVWHDLIVTMDDATGEILSAFLATEEGTLSSLQGFLEVFLKHGLPSCVYTDRGSHYFTTPSGGGKVDKRNPTQVGRALAELGISHIAAYSPQARGRSERAFGTLQDRLVNELRLAKISDVAAANQYIREVYIPDHNRRFGIVAEVEGSAFTPCDVAKIRDAMCIKEVRTVNNDNTIRYKTKVLQLPPTPWRNHFAKAEVRIHDYLDQGIGVFYGPRLITEFDPSGQPRSVIPLKQAA